MNRGDAVRRIACASAGVVLPARHEPARVVLGQPAACGGSGIDSGLRDQVASNLVELSMSTEDSMARL